MLAKPFAIFISEFLNTWTSEPLSKPLFSNIRDHHQSSGHPISPDDFSILSSCSSSFELLSTESLLISKLVWALIFLTKLRFLEYLLLLFRKLKMVSHETLMPKSNFGFVCGGKFS